MTRASLALVPVLAACGVPGPPAPTPTPTPTPASAPRPTISRFELASDKLAGVSGLSGMTRDGAGRLWAVAERRSVLVSFAADGSSIERTSISDVPLDTDLESLAYLGEGRFAAGSENRESRGHDEIVLLDVSDGGAQVVGTLALEYERWGSSGVGNQGIEGLCAAGGRLVAAVEATVGVGAERAAPLAVVDLTSRAVVALQLRLTSPTGKIAALDCQDAGDHISVLAIERHYDIARVLRFTIGGGLRDGDVIIPELVLDWAAEKRARDNPEGMVRLDADNLAIVLDNDFGGAEGPNTLLHLRL